MVSKEARVVEEVVVGKEVNERTETVRDTVRRTDVEVEQVPFEQLETDFRSEWKCTHPGAELRRGPARSTGTATSGPIAAAAATGRASSPTPAAIGNPATPGSTWDKVKDAARQRV